MTTPHWANRSAQPVWHGGDPVPGPLDGRDEAGYADLRDYASIGDGRTIALIARDGCIDWMPLPNLDSVPPFAALLDAEQGGHIALAPVDEASIERRYVPGTNVLETTYTTASGRVRVTDSLNTGLAGRLPWCELGRRIDGLEGSVLLRAQVVPGTCLNTASPWVYDSVHGKVLRVDGLTMAVRTLAQESVRVTDGSITVDYRTGPGSRHLLGLASTESEPLYLPTPQDIDEGVDRTVANWRTWSDAFGWQGPWQEEVQRSALMLKQLIFAPTGALAAAATTSLPESLTKDKNWDYRYSWVRDTAFSLTALFRFGVREETHGAISWMLRILREQGSQPQVLQRLDGEQRQDELHTYDVPGWRGVGPVRSGNQADGQLQLGIYGDIFSIVQLYVDHGNVLDEATGRLLTTVADLACDQWRSPDSGMWELTEQRHYTTSKLGCWQALKHAVHLAEIGQIPGSVDRWRHEAEAIRDWVETHCWNEELGAYEWYPDSGSLDASILLHAISGFDRGERMSRTLDALEEQLGDGPFLYRFTGAADEELTFTACSFWRVSALALVGRVDEARALMDELVGSLNDVGLLSEMIDARTGAFGGNLPQALSHLALINAAITVHSEAQGQGQEPLDDGSE